MQRTLSVRTVTEDEILANDGVIAWKVIDPSAAATSLTITWSDAGVAGCGQVTTALLFETAASVAIGLVADRLDSNIACSGSLVTARAQVGLDAPLATRQVLEPVAFRSSAS